MERHFQHELEHIQDRLLWMAGLVESAVRKATQALFQANAALADQVLSEEDAINQMQMELDEAVLEQIVRQAPMAADARFLLAVARMANDLERIGDQSVNIAEAVVRILRHPQVKPYVDLPRMSALAEGMVHGALDALVHRDPELAKAILLRDDEVDRLRDRIFHELLSYMLENRALVFPAFELILVTKNLERIGDHATNIAEEVIYIVAGRDVRHMTPDRR